MKRLWTLSIIVALAACGGGGSSTAPPGGTTGTSTLSASLMDGPIHTSAVGPITAVNIAIAKVEAIGAGGVQRIATFTPSRQINLLNYKT